MARKRKRHKRKLRTREHVIADLSVNYVERQVYLRGYSVDEFDADYGIDLEMHTYTDRGEVETAHVLFQIKASDAVRVLKDGETIAVTVTVADVKRWQLEWFPVILAIYDAQKEDRNMAVEQFTYRQLDNVLSRLGFKLEYTKDPKDRKWRYYEHIDSDTVIILMDRKPAEAVRATDAVSARRHLVEKGLVSEAELDRLLVNARERAPKAKN